MEPEAFTLDGECEATFQASAVPGAATLSATCGAVSQQFRIDLAGSAQTIVGEAHPELIQENATAQIVVATHDANGVSVPAMTLNLEIVSGGGTLSATSVVTDAEGVGIVQFTAPASADVTIIRVSSGSLTPVEVTVATQDIGITVTCEPALLPPDGTSTAQVTIEATHSDGTPAGDETINLSASWGAISPTSVTTDPDTGIATATLTAGVQQGFGQIKGDLTSGYAGYTSVLSGHWIEPPGVIRPGAKYGIRLYLTVAPTVIGRNLIDIVSATAQIDNETPFSLNKKTDFLFKWPVFLIGNLFVPAPKASDPPLPPTMTLKVEVTYTDFPGSTFPRTAVFTQTLSISQNLPTTGKGAKIFDQITATSETTRKC